MSVDLSGAQWFKSSHSQGGGECVEVAFLDTGHVGMRDSKDRIGPALTFAPDEWNKFLAGVANDQFDRP